MSSEVVSLGSEFADVVVDVDALTGAPRRITAGGDSVDLRVEATIVSGGDEQRAPMGGLEYPAAERVGVAGSTEVTITEHATVDSRTFTVRAGSTRPELWTLEWRYELRAEAPRIGVSLGLLANSDQAVARDLIVDITVLGDRGDWLLHAPGNRVRSGFPLSEMERPIMVLTAGEVDGSSGLVALERPDRSSVFSVWPFQTDRVGRQTLHTANDGVRLEWSTHAAGIPGHGGRLDVSRLWFDLEASSFEALLATVPARMAAAGVTSPSSIPDWVPRARIYEVQIGTYRHISGWEYAPYPEAADLLADLDRIEDLGYDVIQIMPRQPYPSYNVHDYTDIDTSYGDEATIRRLVEDCHRRGMRVILDILMHGVIDGEALTEAIETIERGPWGDRLNDEIPDVTVLDIMDPVQAVSYPIAWSQHVVAFGPDWQGGSPHHHPLIDEKPEWFCRDSSGKVIGIYTKSFDAAHPEWRRWFIDHALDLVRRLDIDGFRFDAPSYNDFANWSERTRTNASISALGTLPLFAQLRGELRRLRPDALMYTEPAGALWRQSMDVNYNYDEQHLIRAVMTGGSGSPSEIRDAAEMAEWLRQRDQALPTGSMTAHHVDSHDSFWWPTPGGKWRREQWGADATAAMMTVFATVGGPYMTFVGGEVEIEDAVRKVNRLRATQPVIGHGSTEYQGADVDDPMVFRVLRRLDRQVALVVVNLARQACETTVRIPASTLTDARPAGDDMLGGGSLRWTEAGEEWVADLRLDPFEAKIIALVG